MALALFSSYGIDCNRMMNLSLRVRLFWVKMISGNHFPPNPHVWLQRKMKFSENSFSVDQYLLLWPENDFTLSFSLQIISGERERERRESPDRREREEEETSPAIAPLVNWRARSSDDRTDLASNLAFTAQSHLLLRRAISIWPNLMNFFAGFCFFCEWVWNWFIICMFTVEEVYGKLGM